MVIRLTALVFSLALAAGCSSVEIKAEYPNQKRSALSESSPSKIETASGKKDGDKKDAYVDEHKGQKTSDYLWPMHNAADLLENTKPGELVDIKREDGKPMVFAVLSEYASAGKKRCKKYFVNLDLHLACYNPHWYPVRSFGE